MFEPLFEVEMLKKCTPFWRKLYFDEIGKLNGVAYKLKRSNRQGKRRRFTFVSSNPHAFIMNNRIEKNMLTIEMLKTQPKKLQ